MIFITVSLIDVGSGIYSFIVYHCDLVRAYQLVLEHYLQVYCDNTKKLLHTGKLNHQIIGLYKIFVPTFSLPIRITYLYFSVPTKKKSLRHLNRKLFSNLFQLYNICPFSQCISYLKKKVI